MRLIRIWTGFAPRAAGPILLGCVLAACSAESKPARSGTPTQTSSSTHALSTCNSDYVSQDGNVTTVRPFDWSSLGGLSYPWYTKDSLLAHVLSGEAKVSAPETPLVKNGAPNPPFLPAVADIPPGSLSQTYLLWGQYSFNVAQTLYGWGIDPRDPGNFFEPPLTVEDLAIYDGFIASVDRRHALGVEYAELSDSMHSQGYFHADSDNLECAIGAAAPGSTLMLEPGTFYLGAYRQEDASLVSSGRGERFSHLKYLYPYFNRSPEYNFAYYDYGSFGNGTAYPWPAVIVVDKPLTITGRHAAESPTPTVITTPQGWSDQGETLYTDAAWFVLASPDITVRQLKFSDTIKGVEAIRAGTTIEDNVFEDTGYYACQYGMDNASAFPNYPSLTPVRHSYLRRNQFRRVIAGPYMYGSGIIATDNEVQIGADRHADGFFGFFYGGGLEMPPDIPMEISMARENRIERNSIEGFAWWGALYVAGHRLDGVVSNNTFSNNQIRDMYAIVEHYGHSLFKDNRVTGNTIEGAPLGVVLYGWDYEGTNAPEGNHFAGNTYRDIWWAGVDLSAATGNRFTGENFADSGLPGWSGGAGAFFLGEATYGNRVSGVVLDSATSLCDQILDLGANITPGTERCEH